MNEIVNYRIRFNRNSFINLSFLIKFIDTLTYWLQNESDKFYVDNVKDYLIHDGGFYTYKIRINHSYKSINIIDIYDKRKLK